MLRHRLISIQRFHARTSRLTSLQRAFLLANVQGDDSSKRPIWRPAATCKENHFGARGSATLGGRHRPLFFSFLFFRQLRRPIAESPGWKLAPGIALLTDHGDKNGRFQGRSFGRRMVDNQPTSTPVGKKRVVPRHVGFNHVTLIKSENWTRFLRFVARNRTKAASFSR